MPEISHGLVSDGNAGIKAGQGKTEIPGPAKPVPAAPERSLLEQSTSHPDTIPSNPKLSTPRAEESRTSVQLTDKGPSKAEGSAPAKLAASAPPSVVVSLPFGPKLEPNTSVPSFRWTLSHGTRSPAEALISTMAKFSSIVPPAETSFEWSAAAPGGAAAFAALDVFACLPEWASLAQELGGDLAHDVDGLGLEVLDAETRLYNAELTYAQTQGTLFQALVNLYKSLGGGWVVKADDMTAKKQ